MSTRKYIASAATIAALIIGILGFRSHMSKLDEDIVYAYYQKNINALRRFDAKTLCGMLDAKFHAVDVAKTPAGLERTELDRARACAETNASMALMREVVEATKADPDLKYTIQSVDLSPDRKRATVKLRMSMKIGKRFSMTSSGTETLVRHLGKVQVLNSETRTAVSVR